jgi:hypothetical protein
MVTLQVVITQSLNEFQAEVDEQLSILPTQFTTINSCLSGDQKIDWESIEIILKSVLVMFHAPVVLNWILFSMIAIFISGILCVVASAIDRCDGETFCSGCGVFRCSDTCQKDVSEIIRLFRYFN